jgi:hypothetical protein
MSQGVSVEMRRARNAQPEMEIKNPKQKKKKDKI